MIRRDFADLGLTAVALHDAKVDALGLNNADLFLNSVLGLVDHYLVVSTRTFDRLLGLNSCSTVMFCTLAETRH